jgi:peroxiredoxin Q/BCP
MQAYQLGVQDFAAADAQVFGISTDNVPSLRRFKEDLKLTFPLLSDFTDRSTVKKYGILMPNGAMAKRVTFVIGLDGKIAHMEENAAAIDTTGAKTACQRNKKPA